MNLLNNHPFLHGMLPAHIALIEKNTQVLDYETGDYLLKEGQPANRFFLIETGLVGVEVVGADKKVLQIQTIGAGEPLGWSWLFPPFTWHFSARALKETRALILSGGQLLVLCEENHDLGYELMRRVAQIAVNRLQASRKKHTG
jgi:CRP-like cAMP-binding protein